MVMVETSTLAFSVTEMFVAEMSVAEMPYIHDFKVHVLQPIKLKLNIHNIIRDYSQYAKLKYYKLQ